MCLRCAIVIPRKTAGAVKELEKVDQKKKETAVQYLYPPNHTLPQQSDMKAPCMHCGQRPNNGMGVKNVTMVVLTTVFSIIAAVASAIAILIAFSPADVAVDAPRGDNITTNARNHMELHDAEKATIKLSEVFHTYSHNDDGERIEHHSYSFFCTGVLISPYLAVTANHCFEDGKLNVKENGTTNIAAEIFYGDSGQVGITGVAFHPERDLAVVELIRPIYINHYPKLSDTVDENKPAYTLGWESDREYLVANRTVPSSTLRVFRNNKHHQDKDSGQFMGLEAPSVVAVSPNASVKPGDSGGAIIQDGKIVGVLSGNRSNPISGAKQMIHYAPVGKYGWFNCLPMFKKDVGKLEKCFQALEQPDKNYPLPYADNESMVNAMVKMYR